MRYRQPHARAKFGDPKSSSSSEIQGEANQSFIIRSLIILVCTLGKLIKGNKIDHKKYSIKGMLTTTVNYKAVDYNLLYLRYLNVINKIN